MAPTVNFSTGITDYEGERKIKSHQDLNTSKFVDQFDLNFDIFLKKKVFLKKIKF